MSSQDKKKPFFEELFEDFGHGKRGRGRVFSVVGECLIVDRTNGISEKGFSESYSPPLRT